MDDRIRRLRSHLKALGRGKAPRGVRWIPGTVPSLLAPPPGCRYADRCPRVLDVCRQDRPVSRAAAPDHEVACHAAEVEHAAARG